MVNHGPQKSFDHQVGLLTRNFVDHSKADICSNVKSSLEVQNFLEYYIGDGEINSPESLLDSVHLSGISHFGITACLTIPELRGLMIGIYFLIFRHKGTAFNNLSLFYLMNFSIISIENRQLLNLGYLR